MTDLLQREDAWAALHDPATDATALAAIAAEHPEFAGAIARHPNAYPELVAWAAGASAADAVALSSAGPREAESSVESRRVRLGRRLWVVVFAVLVGLPVVLVTSLWIGVAVSGGDGDGSEFFGFWEYGLSPLSPSQLLLIGVHLLAIAAAALAAPSVGRRVGSIVLVASAGLLATLENLITAMWSWPMWELYYPIDLVFTALWASLLFVGWGLSRPLRGAGYAALPIVVVVPLLLEFLAWDAVRSWWGVGDWSQYLFRHLLTLVVGNAAIPTVGVYLARVWSRASERRARAAAAARPAYAPGSGIPPTVRTNTMSIMSLIFAFVISVLGVVFGHVALSQIRRTGEEGRGFAIAGLVIGYIGVAVGVVLAFYYLTVLGTLMSLSGSF